MKTLRRLTASLFLYAILCGGVAFGIGQSCVTARGNILARLASSDVAWNPEELTRLSELAALQPDAFALRVERMPPLDRFRLAASFLLSGERGSELRYQFPDHIVGKMEVHAKWLWNHLLKDLSPEQRLRILKDPRAFAEPFRADTRSHRDATHEKWRYEMSLVLDRVFGLDIDTAEKRVPEEYGTPGERGIKSAAGDADWSLRRLSANSQNTTYADMETFFAAAKLKPGQTVVDLGASYGRVGMFISARYPGVKFKGYEINPERVAEGKKIYASLGFTDGELIEQDLSTEAFVLPKAEVYYMYDPVNHITRDILFKKIKARADEAKREGRTIKVICREGRGDFHNWMKQQTWLKPGEKITSVARRGWGSDDSIIYESE